MGRVHIPCTLVTDAVAAQHAARGALDAALGADPLVFAVTRLAANDSNGEPRDHGVSASIILISCERPCARQASVHASCGYKPTNNPLA